MLPLALGDRYVQGDGSLFIRWEEFIAACTIVPLLDWDTLDPTLTDLSDHEPPTPYEPPAEYLTGPPLLSQLDDASRPSIYDRWEWYETVLKKWYEWANTHENGICKTFVIFEDNVVSSIGYRDEIIYNESLEY